MSEPRQAVLLAVAAIMDADEKDLELVVKAIVARRSFLSEMDTIEKQGTLAVGDWVVLGNLTTKYLNGCKGTIKEWKDENTVKVYIEETPSRMAQDRVRYKNVTVPIGCCTLD